MGLKKGKGVEMKEPYTQVKTFDCKTYNDLSNIDNCNEFIKNLGSDIISVTPIFNTVKDVVVYVVTYFQYD